MHRIKTNILHHLFLQVTPPLTCTTFHLFRHVPASKQTLLRRVPASTQIRQPPPPLTSLPNKRTSAPAQHTAVHHPVRNVSAQQTNECASTTHSRASSCTQRLCPTNERVLQHTTQPCIILYATSFQSCVGDHHFLSRLSYTCGRVCTTVMSSFSSTTPSMSCAEPRAVSMASPTCAAKSWSF